MNFLTHIAADGTPTVIPIDFAKVFGTDIPSGVNEIRLFVRDCEVEAMDAADRVLKVCEHLTACKESLDAIEATLESASSATWRDVR